MKNPAVDFCSLHTKSLKKVVQSESISKLKKTFSIISCFYFFCPL